MDRRTLIVSGLATLGAARAASAQPQAPAQGPSQLPPPNPAMTTPQANPSYPASSQAQT